MNGWTKNNEGTYSMTVDVPTDHVRLLADKGLDEQFGECTAQVMGPDGLYYSPAEWLARFQNSTRRTGVIYGAKA